MFCLVLGLVLGLFAIKCFRQWGESEERESAACRLLSHHQCTADCFTEDERSYAVIDQILQ